MLYVSDNMNYISKKLMNIDIRFCNSSSGKMIKVAFQVSQGSVAT